MPRRRDSFSGELFAPEPPPDGQGDLPPIYSFEDLRKSGEPEGDKVERPDEPAENDALDVERERILGILRKAYPDEEENILRRRATIEANWAIKEKKDRGTGKKVRDPRRKEN